MPRPSSVLSQTEPASPKRRFLYFKTRVSEIQSCSSSNPVSFEPTQSSSPLPAPGQPVVPVPEGRPFGSAPSAARPPGHRAPPPARAVSVTRPGDGGRSLGPCMCCALPLGGSLHPEADEPSGAVARSVGFQGRPQNRFLEALLSV